MVTYLEVTVLVKWIKLWIIMLLIILIHPLYSSKINKKYINWRILDVPFIVDKIMVQDLEMVVISMFIMI